MYALHVTFTSTIDAADLRAGKAEFARHLAAVPGFVSKSWLRDGATHGGFYLFRTCEAAEAYLDGPLFGLLRGNAAFRDLAVRGYSVDTEFAEQADMIRALAG